MAKQGNLDFFEKNSQYISDDQREKHNDQQIQQGNQGDMIDVVVSYLAAKPEKSLDPVLERLERILFFRQDILSSALLAASFYSMEELHMRLPRLDEILRNPFDTEEKAEAVSGTILIADGGPAEGAKAIQLYMLFAAKGIDVSDPAVIRMLGLLGILADRPVELVSEIQAEQDHLEVRIREEQNPVTNQNEENRNRPAGQKDYLQMSETERCLYACGSWLEHMLSSPEKTEQWNLTAQNLLEGMPQELAAILGACLMENR